MGISVADYVGYAGGFVSAITFLPQVIKLWKTKSVKDLSSLTLFFLFLS
jgi:MtN3 and saliva related transmembrane protein